MPVYHRGDNPDEYLKKMKEYKAKQELSDRINNALVEQAICEINSMSNLAYISDKQWHTFTENINFVACNISVIYDIDLKKDRANLSKFAHWNRNTFNRVPETWKDFLEYQYNNEGWELQVLLGSGYHMVNDDGMYNIKFVHKDGSEAVYTLKTKELLVYNSTYNYGKQDSWLDGVMGDHVNLDVATHNKWSAPGATEKEKETNSPKAFFRAASLILPGNGEAYEKRERAIDEFNAACKGMSYEEYYDKYKKVRILPVENYN